MLQKAPNQLAVTIVEARERLDLVKVFLQFNKPAPNVVVMVKLLVSFVDPVVEMEKFKAVKVLL